MSAHTPGPWAVNPFNAQVDSAVKGAPVPVCQMLWPTSLRTEDETEANARLIAAAPDMLAALQKIAAYRPLTFAECSDAEAVIGIAEAAIAKATEAA